MGNVAVIQGIYDAFATGDIPTMLGPMHAGTVWDEAEDFPYADTLQTAGAPG